MAIKKLQKMFYLSNEYVKKFIDLRLEDLSDKTQRSASYIIETILVNGLLPENDVAKNIIKNNLYPIDDQGGVQKTLIAVFGMNEAGTYWKSIYSNFKPLVEYCISYVLSNPNLNEMERYLPLLLTQLDSIISQIENCTNSCIELFDRSMYLTQLKTAKLLYQSLQDDPSKMIPKNYFLLIRDCWDMLDDWTTTYRYLSILSSVCHFEESTSARNQLYDIISDISQEW